MLIFNKFASLKQYVGRTKRARVCNALCNLFVHTLFMNNLFQCAVLNCRSIADRVSYVGPAL